MTLPALLLASQVLDGLAFQLAQGHGSELVPSSALLAAAFGPGAVLALKVVAGCVLAMGALALRRHRSLLLWMSAVGFVGAFSEVWAIA